MPWGASPTPTREKPLKSNGGRRTQAVDVVLIVEPVEDFELGNDPHALAEVKGPVQRKIERKEGIVLA